MQVHWGKQDSLPCLQEKAPVHHRGLPIQVVIFDRMNRCRSDSEIMNVSNVRFRLFEIRGNLKAFSLPLRIHRRTESTLTRLLLKETANSSTEYHLSLSLESIPVSRREFLFPCGKN